MNQSSNSNLKPAESEKIESAYQAIIEIFKQQQNNELESYRVVSRLNVISQNLENYPFAEPVLDFAKQRLVETSQQSETLKDDLARYKAIIDRKYENPLQSEDYTDAVIHNDTKRINALEKEAKQLITERHEAKEKYENLLAPTSKANLPAIIWHRITSAIENSFMLRETKEETQKLESLLNETVPILKKLDALHNSNQKPRKYINIIEQTMRHGIYSFPATIGHYSLY